MTTLKPGDEIRVVEYNDATKQPIEGGEIFRAEVVKVTEAYVHIRYMEGAGTGQSDTFWRESGWRAWDGEFRWRLEGET